MPRGPERDESAMGKARWTAVLLVIATGLVAWRALGVRSEREPTAAMARPDVPAPASPGKEARVPGEMPARRQPLTPADEFLPADGWPDAAVDAPSPLARRLDEVAGSFLTEEPRVAELLGLVQELAGCAAVVPSSVRVERDDQGAPRSARGELAVGDLRATFVLDEDGYHIDLPAALDAAPWSRRDLHIAFEEDPSGVTATGCRATVQFHPRYDLPASGHLAPEEEALVGWGVSVSPETGARCRPLTLRASGEGWTIGGGEGVQARELPGISGTVGFDAWLDLLRPYAER